VVLGPHHAVDRERVLLRPVVAANDMEPGRRNGSENRIFPLRNRRSPGPSAPCARHAARRQRFRRRRLAAPARGADPAHRARDRGSTRDRPRATATRGPARRDPRRRANTSPTDRMAPRDARYFIYQK